MAEAGVSSKAKLQFKTQGAFNEVFGESEIVKPLRQYNGIVMPYSPLINMSYNSNYTDITPLHSNFAYPFYQNSQFSDFTVSFTLTANTQEDASYMLACHHFLRTSGKMFQEGGYNFDSNNLVGSPPPVLKFSAYGDMMFKNIPVVLVSYNFTLESDMQYVEAIADGSSSSYVPVKWDMICSLKPAYNPREVRKQFNLKDFASGKLIRNGYQ